jgi:hypothetical protein
MSLADLARRWLLLAPSKYDLRPIFRNMCIFSVNILRWYDVESGCATPYKMPKMVRRQRSHVQTSSVATNNKRSAGQRSAGRCSKANTGAGGVHCHRVLRLPSCGIHRIESLGVARNGWELGPRCQKKDGALKGSDAAISASFLGTL